VGHLGVKKHGMADAVMGVAWILSEIIQDHFQYRNVGKCVNKIQTVTDFRLDTVESKDVLLMLTDVHP